MVMKTAEQLHVGDTIAVWWKPNRDTITKLWPYTGPLECIKGARMAEFAINRGGMTLEPGSVYEVISTAGIPHETRTIDPLAERITGIERAY